MESSRSSLDLEKANGQNIPLIELNHAPGSSSTSYQPIEDVERNLTVNKDDEIPSIIYLHGLRGLAAAVVYNFHHMALWYGYPNDLSYQLGYKGKYHFLQLPFIRWIWTGLNLSIFFFLSGYVLSISNLRRLRNNKRRECYQNLVSAAIRRPFRLYVPTIGISFVFAIFIHFPSDLRPLIPQPQSNIFLELKEFISESLAIMNPFTEHTHSTNLYFYNIPAWTMPVELAGSWIVYFLIALLSLGPRHYEIIIFAITGIILFFTHQWHFASLIGGVVLAINDLDQLDHKLLKNLSSRHRTIFYNLILALGFWLISQPHKPLDPDAAIGTMGWGFLFNIMPSNYANSDEPFRFYDTIGSLFVMYGILRVKWMQKFFSSRVLLFLGLHCVSIYLTHAPFGLIFGDRVQRFFGKVRNPDIKTMFDNVLPLPDYGPVGLTFAYLVSQCLILPGNLAIAWLATKWFDRPGIEISRRVVNMLGYHITFLRNKEWELRS